MTPRCNCGAWCKDGAALRDHLAETHPGAGRGLVTDGGRRFNVQPETCPECGLTLDAAGECVTQGCPGPESSEAAQGDAGRDDA